MIVATGLFCLLHLASGCDVHRIDPLCLGTDHSMGSGSSRPIAIDPSRVGCWPAATKSGSGRFYDDVLEYRVWIQAPDAFARWEPAEAFSQATERATTRVDRRARAGRLRGTEWVVAWLEGAKRDPTSIESFLQNPRPGRTNPAQTESR